MYLSGTVYKWSAHEWMERGGCSVPGLLLKAVDSTSCSLVQAVTTVSVESTGWQLMIRLISATKPLVLSRAEARGNDGQALYTEGGWDAVIYTLVLQEYFMNNIHI